MKGFMAAKSGSFRSLAGFAVLGSLAVLLGVMYATIRQHGATKPPVSDRPRLDPPTLVARVQEPLPLVAGQRQAVHGTDSCVIASINGTHYSQTAKLQRGTVIGLGGWLIDKISRSVPNRAWIVMVGDASTGSYQAPILLHEKRPDVSEYFGGVAGYRNSGFIVDVASQSLPVGTYHLYIIFEGRGVYYSCDNGRQLRLK